MKGCRPLSKEEVFKVIESFSGYMRLRNQALFVFGCCTGFRISELLSITRGDVIGKDGKLFDCVTVRKALMKGQYDSRTVHMTASAKRYLLPWLQEQEQRGHILLNTPLFCRNGGGRWDRVNAWRTLRNAYARAGLSGKVATHSMRKTFANGIYDFYEGRKDAMRITAKAMGHKSLDSTDKYLSFLDEDVTIAIDHIGKILENWD